MQWTQYAVNTVDAVDAINVGTLWWGSAIIAKRSSMQGIEPMQSNAVNVGTWCWG